MLLIVYSKSKQINEILYDIVNKCKGLNHNKKAPQIATLFLLENIYAAAASSAFFFASVSASVKTPNSSPLSITEVAPAIFVRYK